MPDTSNKNFDDPNGGSGRSEDLKRAADGARARAGEAINEIKVAGNQLVDRVRDLIEEGNVRRIVIRRGDKTLLEIPLTVGVGAGAAAVLFSPILAAVGALAALVSEITLVVEREGDDDDEMDEPGRALGSGSGSSTGSGASMGGGSSAGGSSMGSSGSTGGGSSMGSGSSMGGSSTGSGSAAGNPDKTVGRSPSASEGGDAGI